jgi:hypothetical protein
MNFQLNLGAEITEREAEFVALVRGVAEAYQGAAR